MALAPHDALQRTSIKEGKAAQETCSREPGRLPSKLEQMVHELFTYALRQAPCSSLRRPGGPLTRTGISNGLEHLPLPIIAHTARKNTGRQILKSLRRELDFEMKMAENVEIF